MEKAKTIEGAKGLSNLFLVRTNDKKGDLCKRDKKGGVKRLRAD